MKKIVFLLVLFLIATSSAIHAHPPRGINLQYDSQKKLLLIDVNHVSRDNVNHYINKIEITKNGESPSTKYFRQQKNPTSFYKEISYTLEEDDIVTVRAYSRKGGSKEVELEITKEVLEQEVTRKKAPSRSKSVRPSNKSKIKAAVPKDPEVSKPVIPRDKSKIKPAFTRDPDVVKPAHPQDSSKVKPAFTRDPDVAKPTHPKDSSKVKPAIKKY